MSTISIENQPLTIINVFTVQPEKQQQMIDELVKITEYVMSKLPGFISANIHKSPDGTHVTNYAQWRSKEDLDNVFRNPTARAHMEVCKATALNMDFSVYQVVSIHSPSTEANN